MGYRSKVVIGVKIETAKEFDKILTKHDFKPNKSNDYLKISDTDGYKTYLFDYIKWYDSDDWCGEIMDWLNDTYGFKEDCWCVGMGEDGEIHSEVGEYWHYVDIIRDINLIHEKH